MNIENAMNNEQKNSQYNGHNLDSSSQTKSDQTKHSGQKQSESHVDSEEKKTEARRAGSDKQNQSDDRGRSGRETDYQKEEPMKDPNQFQKNASKREDKNYNDQSDRA